MSSQAPEGGTLQRRHDDEIGYWDRLAERRLERTKDFRRPRVPGHVELFESIEYLRPVIEFWGDLRGKRVIDLGCGNGWITLGLAASGARATGIDLSPKLVEVASRYAHENGLSDRVDFRAMPCEALDFPDGEFDCAIMHAALHHCDIAKTAAELRRVLKPGGKAVFFEDYAYHPLMRVYRRFTRSRHTRYETPLTDADVALVVSGFSWHRLEYYGLLNLFHTSKSRFARLGPTLSRADRRIMQAWPSASRYAKILAVWVVK